MPRFMPVLRHFSRQNHHKTLSQVTFRTISIDGRPKETCLIDFHRKKMARMESFAGYLMPIVYKDQTIKSEHFQTREAASAFDVSHMMQTTIHGKDRVKYIESLTVADIDGLNNDKCTLSALTNEQGGIIDDCIISKRQDHLYIVSNAGNADTVWSWLNSNLSNNLDVQVKRLEGRGLIALQGPKASQTLQKVVKRDLSDIEFMNCFDTKIEGVGDCLITRCGYTGEDGFEISVEASQAEHLMELLCKSQEVLPAGLGARDTLRLEAGLCLHGHDITDTTTPVEATLAWIIHKNRRVEGGFPGSKIILDQLKNGTTIKRVGLEAINGGPPVRENCRILNVNDERDVGKVTSGTFAPKVGKNIAMAYVESDLGKMLGTSVNCLIRGKIFEYKLTKMPFVKVNYYFKQR